MSTRLHTQENGLAPKSADIASTNLLRRKCACGGSAGLSGQCAECGNKRLAAHRKSTNHTGPESVPAIVQEVLRSPGRPLDPSPRAVMEQQFGHDFSQVRVHTDARAAESTEAVNALAYTVGQHIVFGAGKYVPQSAAGQQLLAHELAHVRQQTGPPMGAAPLELGRADSPAEQEADAAAGSVQDSNRVFLSAPAGVPAGLIQRLSSSSSGSSGSSGAGDGGAPGPTPSGPSCKIDVRATHIGGALSRFPIWHLFIVYTDGAGTEYYFRGGPGGSCPGVTGDYGTIISTHGAYVAGTVDWDPSAPSVTVLSGSSACGKDTCFAAELSRIDGTCTPYAPTGPNSNTVASTLLSNCSVPRSKPVRIAPGWGDPNL